MLPKRLRGNFRVDDLIQAIRVNGTSTSVPKHTASSFKEGPTSFVLDGSLLKAGQNKIEFDVRNAGKREGFADTKTRLALWVQWNGER